MRGIVLSTKELAEVDWPAIAARSGINTIGTHITPSEVVTFLNTDKGRAFTEACRKNNITVEHQLHAMAELLPRDLFEEDPEMFRMDSSGVRTAVELPWHPEVCLSDLDTYAGYGLRHVTSFAVYMDAEYFERFPSLEPVEEYGSLLQSYTLPQDNQIHRKPVRN